MPQGYRTVPSKFHAVRIVVACGVLLAISLAAATTTAVGTADSTRYLADIKTLAAPDMEGRGPGTQGLARASQYLERRYKTLGLQPAGTNGYLQAFTVTTGAKLKADNELIVENGAAKQRLAINQDFEPVSFSSSGSFAGPLVFVGYGASADEFQYDDYAGIDVKDKIVVLLRYEPDSFAVKSGHQGLTQHSQLVTKAINARNHGAKAVVLVNGKLAEGEDDSLMRFGSTSGPENAGILLVQVKNAIAEGWFKAAGKSLADVQQQINGGKPASFAFPDTLRLALKVDIESTHAQVNNVLAYLPGKTDEYVIVGAHYDHLGRGYSNSLAPSQIGQIHPGADDNASGTAGVLELARMFAPLKGQLDRGILFMSFSGRRAGAAGFGGMGEKPDHAFGQVRGHDQHGHDWAHPRQQDFHWWSGNRLDLQNDSGAGAEEDRLQN